MRRLPHNRKFILAAGLAQAVEYLLNLRFTARRSHYLRGLPQFERAAPEFFEMLAGLRFTGDLFAVPEGTPMFAGEPFLTVRASADRSADRGNVSAVHHRIPVDDRHQSRARGKGRPGTRAWSSSARAARIRPKRACWRDAPRIIGGCAGTSNTETGLRYKVHVFGTAAHSWVMSFPTELAAFEQFQQLLGERTVYLIDTYDTLEGAGARRRSGRRCGACVWIAGIWCELAPAVRKILDDAGSPRCQDHGHRRSQRVQDSRTGGRAGAHRYVRRGNGTGDFRRCAVTGRDLQDGRDGRRAGPPLPIKLSQEKQPSPGPSKCSGTRITICWRGRQSARRARAAR